MAFLGGMFSGFCASRIGYQVQNLFDDEEHWHNCAYDVPLEEEEVLEAPPAKTAMFWSHEPRENTEEKQMDVYEHESESDGKENIQ